MFSSQIKKIGLLICVSIVCSCGLFSNDKELPLGTRISVLGSGNVLNVLPAQIPNGEIPSPVHNKDWSQTGGNPQHVMTNLSASNNMQEIWTKNFGKGNSKRNLLLAQPIIYNNHVYAQDVNGTVSAYQLNDGKKIWKQKLKPQRAYENESGLNGSGLAADSRAVYAVTGFGSVFALTPKSGKVIWRKDLDTPLRTSPTLCDNKLLIQSLDNRFFALNPEDGEELWRYNISAEDTVLAGGAAPACSAEKNLVVAGFSNGEIQAFNAGIGYPLWSASLINNQSVNSSTDINAIKAAPAIDDDIIFAVGHNDLTVALDYRTGEKRWEKKIGGTNMPWVAGNYLFILANTNELYALNKNSGEILWTTRLLEDYELKERAEIYLMGPVMINNQLLIAASNGLVYALTPENGAITHKLDLGSGLPVAPVAADNTVIFITDEADLVAYQ